MEAERTAGDVLADVPPWIWDGTSLPVPVERIADTRFGLLVRRVPEVAATGLGSSLSGMLLPDAREILVLAGDDSVRRRFTVAHELGHWCLHRQHGEPVYARARLSSGSDVEHAADAFAAALLVPPGLLAEEARREPDPVRLGWRFGVSPWTIRRRVARLRAGGTPPTAAAKPRTVARSPVRTAGPSPT